MNYPTQFRITARSLLVFLALGFFAVCESLRAVVPAPDGGYPGFNTAEGQNALFNLTTGVGNTGVGWFSLWGDTEGSYNTAVGAGTLLFNVGDQSKFLGVNNTAVGAAALLFNRTGSDNTATGIGALLSNTEGTNNTATGEFALTSNTTGNLNTANGLSALYSNTTGIGSTAVGGDALVHNTTGGGNTAIGTGALDSNITGNGNIAIGLGAGHALTTGDHNIVIGNADAVAGESNTIRIGNSLQTATYIAGISGAVVPGGVAVIVDGDGHLGTVVSSQRVKDEIKPMDKASEAILALKPVTFRYKKEIDPKSIPQFGLVAEEVAKVDPDLVARDAKGEPYTVRYEAVNAMLLNEFLKAHKVIEEQQTTIAQLKKEMQTVVARLNANDSTIQRVSNQVQINSPEARVAMSDH